MITHGPMSHASIHNSWKLKMFFHGLHKSPDMSPIGHVWNALDARVPVPNNFAQPLKRSGTTFHNQHPDQLYTKEMRTGSDPNPYFFMMHICIPNHVKYMD
jgi:hypothetical protein